MSNWALAILICAFTVNAISFFIRGKFRWWNFTAALLMAITIGVAQWSNISAGCYPWSPKVVPYHDGMIICPGQSAQMQLPLIILRDREKTPGI